MTQPKNVSGNLLSTESVYWADKGPDCFIIAVCVLIGIPVKVLMIRDLYKDKVKQRAINTLILLEQVRKWYF
jgi:hypothetical protein